MATPTGRGGESASHPNQPLHLELFGSMALGTNPWRPSQAQPSTIYSGLPRLESSGVGFRV